MSRRAETIRAEIASIEAILGMGTPPGPFGDGGLSARLRLLKAELASLDVAERQLAMVEAYMRGARYVHHSIGIDPKFAGPLMAQLETCIRAHTSQVVGEEGQLMVTGVVSGRSFGFRIEEVASQLRFEGKSPLAQAVDHFEETLAGLLSEDLDTEWLEGLDAAVVHSAGKLFKLLDAHEAEMDLVSPDFERTLRSDQVARARRIVCEIRVDESEHDLVGVLRGLRLESHDFDFLSADGLTAIKGSLGPELDLYEAKRFFDQPCTVTVRTVQRGHPSGRLTTRHFLVDVGPPPDDSD